MAYLLALGSAVLYGAADFLGGIAARRSSTIAVVILSQFAGLLTILLMLPFLPPAQSSTADLGWGSLAGLTGGTGVALLYRALAIGRMAVVAPITAVCAVVVPVMVEIVFGRQPAARTLAGISLAMVAIVLVSQQPTSASAGDSRRRHILPLGSVLALLSGIAIGLFFLSLARTHSTAGFWPLVAARATSVTLFAAIAVAGAKSLKMPAGAVRIAIAGGVVDMLANALYLIASRYGSLSVVVTLSSLYPASTVVLARIVLGEHLSAWQALGLGCAIGAVALIVR